MAFWNRRREETLPAKVEQRYGIDPWISDYLLPASWQSFLYSGQQYPITGLNQTLSGQRAIEVSQTLPSYTAALRRCPPAFGAQMVRALVLSQARFTFRARPYGPASTARRLFGTNELQTLEQPWPNGTSGELISRMEWCAGLAGNAYVTNYTQNNRLRVLRPDWVQILYGSQREPDDPSLALDGEVISYIYANKGFGSGYTPEFLPPSSVAHWSPIPDPECAGLGMSWITPAVRDIMSDQLMTDHKIKFFEQGATPNLVVRGLQAQDQTEFNRLVDMMEANHAGLRNAYRTLYLTAGADATVVGANLQQIDFKSTQGTGETRIAMLSRVHPVILGLSEGLAGSSLNAGNFAMARRIWGDTWIYPTLQDLCRALAPLLRIPDNAELWFDVTDMPVLREDAKDAAEIIQIKATTIEGLVKEGFTPKSSIAAVEGQNMNLLEHTGLVSVQLQPPGMAMPGSPADTSAPPVPGQQGNPPPNGRAPVPTANGNPARALRYDENQPRDEHGRWGSGDGSANPKVQVAEAKAKLRDGKAATVDPGQMHALMTELGSSPPSVNLAQLRVTGKGNENLYIAGKEIPRAQMPQLPGTPERLGEFSAKLAENGLTAEMKTVDPRELHMTQNQLDSQKVAGLYDKLLNGGWSEKTVLITDKDGNLLDGQHRWAAAAAANASGKADFRVNTFRVNTDIDTLLSVAHEVSLPAREFARSITFGDKPPMPPPSDDEPWLWADGQWWLVVTDTADDVPSMLRIEGRSLRFSEDQPRDEHGRWTSGGGGEGTAAGAATATAEKPTPLTDAEFAAHTREVEAKIGAALKAGQSTDKTMTVNGAGEVYDAERSAQQQEVINELYDRMAATAGEDGKAIVMGGLGGAGKSTVLANNLGVDTSDYVTINPDDIKEAMAARGMVPDVGLSPMESASLVHEESSAMANRMAARAMADHKNIIYDITMSSEGSVQKRLDRLSAAGYTNVHGVFVDIPVEKSVDSAMSRYRSGMEAYRAGEGSGGRYVPPFVIRASTDPTGEYNSANRAHFEALKPQFDSWSLYDRSGTGPAKLVGRTGAP